MNETKAKLRAFQLKGSLMTLTVLELLNPDMAALQAQLDALVKKTPDLFRRMPVIIDLNKVQALVSAAAMQQLFSLLKDHGLVPVGIRGGNNEQQQAVITAGLPFLSNTRSEKTEANVSATTEPEESSTNAKATAKLITQPVRSGQRIYAKGSDLIILASVSPGAEILSDGNIHVYGVLRGRALAGVTGNKHTRIFCQKLDAELVSIAGHYWINEDLSPLPDNQIVQVYLENDRLHISTF